MCDLWMDVDAALAEVPVNIMPLLDDTDFKSREVAIVYNQAGMDLVWNFVTTAGAYTQTAVTPTTAGTYDWAHQGDGMYSIEIPASGGASINNDTEGYGWFTGFATGVLPWRGPIIGFRAGGLNDKLIDSAYDATRGLAGTALPAAAAEAAGGLYTRGTGAGQINQQANGQVDANLERWINVAPLALSSQRVQVLVGAITNGVIAAATFAANALDAVWSTATRVLTAGTNIALAKGTGVTGFNDLSAAQVNAEADTAIADAALATAANLATVDTVVDAILLDTGTDGVVVAAASKTGYRLSSTGVDDVWDEVMEGSLTARQFARGFAAALLGELSGAGTTTIEIRDASDTKVRITATVDANGNRSVVVLDLT